MSAKRVMAALLAAAAGCSGDGDEPAAGLPPSSWYAARCESPRPPSWAYADLQGTLADEKAWVRSWIDELYLWYGEVPPVDPAAYPTPVELFYALRTPAFTATGKPKDRYHFAVATAEWEALSQAGLAVGYGAQWVVLSAYPPRRMVVAYVEPGSPAAAAGLGRGAEVLAVDGVDLASGPVDPLNAGIAPAAPGEAHAFTVRDLGGAEREVTLTAAVVESSPVLDVRTIPTDTGLVGYVLFNSHVGTAEWQLAEAFHALAAARVDDLVLDLRYNGGGYLFVASEAAFMIAGRARTAGRTFERMVFNEKHPTTNPATGEPLAPVPFIGQALGFSLPPGEPLPELALGRVFVLTGAATCSASEAIVNGLRGIGVEVVQIGETTCGKPYGFYPADNCGTTYFAVQFQGVNALGFGDYGDGFAPGAPGPAGIPGCRVADDFAHALGDPAEARLAAALRYRETGSCPAGQANALRAAGAGAPGDGRLVRSPLWEGRIAGP